jgi:hypothetical protein
MKLKDIISTLLVEADKKDILMKKVGLIERVATEFSEICGAISVIMFNKFMEYAIKINTENPDIYSSTGLPNTKGETLKEKIINRINLRNDYLYDYFGGREGLVGLMDYIRIGLFGDFNRVKNLPLDELIQKSKEWHDSLQIGSSKIDYVEKKEIILDFRENEEGFYWVKLGGTSCSEEAKRMGHCASSSGYLYSLRSYKRIGNGHTLNKSHLTASINRAGDLLQLKGPKNTKPSKEYNKYILPLLYFKDGENYLIYGFGSEYGAEKDFNLSDLTSDEVKKLYNDRPELFSKAKERKLLFTLGLIDVDINIVDVLNSRDEVMVGEIIKDSNIKGIGFSSDGNTLEISVNKYGSAMDGYVEALSTYRSYTNNTYDTTYSDAKNDVESHFEETFGNYLENYYNEHKEKLIENFGNHCKTYDGFYSLFIEDLKNDDKLSDKYVDEYANINSSLLSEVINDEISKLEKHLDYYGGYSLREIQINLEKMINFIKDKDIFIIDNLNSFIEEYLEYYELPNGSDMVYYDLDYDREYPDYYFVEDLLDDFFEKAIEDINDEFWQDDETQECIDARKRFVEISKKYFNQNNMFENEFVRMEIPTEWYKTFSCEYGVKINYENKKTNQKYNGYMQVDNITKYLTMEPLFEIITKKILREIKKGVI